MINQNQIELRKIKPSFFSDNLHLVEILDDKSRGYGYIHCLVDEHNFAIPLRSSIKHNHRFPISTPHDSNGVKGLDYTKAIIVPENYLNGVFVIDNSEYRRIYRDRKKIINEFKDYVDNYKKFLRGEEISDEYKDAYRYTTLINYHEQLS